MTWDWDAVVIGAGPAGSVTARELARLGSRVLLVDKATFPRTKVCGCCLNGAAARTLARLGLQDTLRDAIPLRRVQVAAGKHAAELRLPDGCALSREAFDMRLIDAAQAAGVEFRPNTVARTHHAGEVHLEGETHTARVVIVATGLAGGEATPEAGSRIGAGVVLSATAALAFFTPGTIHMATGSGGYVGFVRVEDGRLDVAAAFDAAFMKANGGPGRAAEAILQQVGWPVPSGFATAAWKGTPPLTRRPLHLGRERLFVTGDAAGYVEPFTGEGMAWAIMSAAALAPLAHRAITKWDNRLIAEWEATHRQVIGRRQRVCRMVSRVLRSPALTTIAVRSLRTFPAFARPVVSSLNRPSSLPHGASV